MKKSLHNTKKTPSSDSLAGSRDKKEKISEGKHPKSISNTTPSLQEENLLLFSGEGIRLSIVSKHENKKQYLKMEFVLLGRPMREMFCHFFVELFPEKSLFYQ